MSWSDFHPVTIPFRRHFDFYAVLLHGEWGGSPKFRHYSCFTRHGLRPRHAVTALAFLYAQSVTGFSEMKHLTSYHDGYFGAQSLSFRGG